MGINLRGEYAGFVSRMIAYGIDLAVVTISLILLGWLVNTTQSLLSIPDFLTPELSLIISGVVAFLIVVGYYVILWTAAGQTVGKLIMGLRVVSAEGKPHITFGQSVRRFIGYIVSAIPLFAGFIWILIDNERQGWHDKIAGTHVVYDWEARVNLDRLRSLQARFGSERTEEQ